MSDAETVGTTQLQSHFFSSLKKEHIKKRSTRTETWPSDISDYIDLFYNQPAVTVT